MLRFLVSKPVILGTSLLAALLVVGAVWVSLDPVPSARTAKGELPGAVPAVSVASMTSDEGPLTAGGRVTLTGKNLAAVTAVTFNQVRASNLQHVDDDTIVLTVPPVTDFTPSTVAIAVKIDGQKAASTVPLTYTYEVQTDVDRQMQYLFTYWDDYNVAEYGDLNDVGGDCANFVSQSLIARGWTMTDDWYSQDAGAGWSDAWGFVPSFDDWLRSNPQYGATQLGFDQRDQVKVGDIVVFDWDNDGVLDHVQVVSSVKTVNGQIKIGMVGHNTDSDYRDLDDTITIDHPGATGWFWSIP